MTPISGDLVTIVCRVNGTHRAMRVQGVMPTSNPFHSWMLVTAPCGLELYAATRPVKPHGAVVVHETNWALRVLAICHAIALAVQAEHNRVLAIRAAAIVARIYHDNDDETIVEDMEAA